MVKEWFSEYGSELGSVPGSLPSFVCERNSVLEPFQWTELSTVNLFSMLFASKWRRLQCSDCNGDFKYSSEEIPCFFFFPMKNSAKEGEANFLPSF